MWFDVDKAGLAALLEHRGKSFAIFELVQNAWDAEPSNVSVRLEPISGSPYATLTVEDDSAAGWADLSQAFTMFSRSRRGADPTKRGRFCLGEKLVLSLCRSAKIVSTTGTVIFGEGGRRQSKDRRERGTLFAGEIRMTRDELQQVASDMLGLIPPVPTTFNGEQIVTPTLVKTFDVKLPTMISDDEGNLRPSVRLTTVSAYAGEVGGILEMGTPVCAAEWPWLLDVHQKVPLGMGRDSVTDAFRRALQVAAVNELGGTLDEQQAATPWVSESIGDGRIKPGALACIVVRRFGERAVVAVPGDPVANATAEAMGSTVIHGGALSAEAWANVRKHALLPTTSQAYPTPKPLMNGETPAMCPLCKQALKV